MCQLPPCVPWQTYGYEVLFTLDNLETLGLLKVKKGSNPWPAVRK